jgi:hypothetical protein
MIGGPPIFLSAPPPFAQAMPMQPPPGQAYLQQPQRPPVSNPAPAWAAAPSAAPPSTPAPRYIPRAKESDDENHRLQLPSPEQLGLTANAVAASVPRLDWSAIHQRLDQLGATCFHLEKLARGCRVTCLLPTAQADRSHRIEAEAATEAEAVAIAVTQAESWARNGK